jgi:hypothetical protein
MLDEILDAVSQSLHFSRGVDRNVMSVPTRAVDGETPPHIAALRGDRHAIEMLLDAGAEIDALGDMS